MLDNPGPWLPQYPDAAPQNDVVIPLPMWDPGVGTDEARRRGYYGHYGNRLYSGRTGVGVGPCNNGACAVSPVTRYPFWAVSPLRPASYCAPQPVCRVAAPRAVAHAARGR